MEGLIFGTYIDHAVYLLINKLPQNQLSVSVRLCYIIGSAFNVNQVNINNLQRETCGKLPSWSNKAGNLPLKLDHLNTRNITTPPK